MMEDIVAKQSFLAKLADAQTGNGEERLRDTESPEGQLDSWTQCAEWWEAPVTGSSIGKAEETAQIGSSKQLVRHQVYYSFLTVPKNRF